MAKSRPHDRYSNMDFPEYEYREYPKAVTHNDKMYVVNDAEEEAALRATVRDFHKEALDRAKELKLDVDPKWETARINALIRKTEADIEFARFDEPKPNKLALKKAD